VTEQASNVPLGSCSVAVIVLVSAGLDLRKARGYSETNRRARTTSPGRGGLQRPTADSPLSPTDSATRVMGCEHRWHEETITVPQIRDPASWDATQPVVEVYLEATARDAGRGRRHDPEDGARLRQEDPLPAGLMRRPKGSSAWVA